MYVDVRTEHPRLVRKRISINQTDCDRTGVPGAR